jgi:hypothetical protein
LTEHKVLEVAVIPRGHHVLAADERDDVLVAQLRRAARGATRRERDASDGSGQQQSHEGSDQSDDFHAGMRSKWAHFTLPTWVK